MCASQKETLTTPTSTDSSSSQKPSSKPEPKWMTMKKQNKSSAGKTAKPIAKQSSGSAQKPSNESRSVKRTRWAKKAVPKQKPVVKRGPVREYVSVCCSAPATKPPCGTKVVNIDPETGKPAKKDKATGLGHFRCSQCHKACKVKPQAPTAKVATKPATTPEVDVATLSVGVGEVPIASA